jgi:hypothetical protein
LRPTYEAGRLQEGRLDYVELLHSPAAAVERLAELRAGATRELLAFARTAESAFRARRHTENRCQARSVCELSLLASKRAERPLETQTRFVPELPHELLLVDEAVAVFSLPDPVAGGSQLTTIVVAHPALARTCKFAFEAVWERALAPEQAREVLRVQRHRPRLEPGQPAAAGGRNP